MSEQKYDQILSGFNDIINTMSEKIRTVSDMFLSFTLSSSRIELSRSWWFVGRAQNHALLNKHSIQLGSVRM